MPITIPGLTGTLILGMFSTGNIGTAVPKLAQGLAIGTIQWLQASTIDTTDAGTFGVGVGTAPFLVPQPLLMTSLLKGFAQEGILGVMSPLLALGLAQGFSLGFLQGLIFTTHPSIGVGAGVGKLVGSPAFPFLKAGLESVKMDGEGSIKKAKAISAAFKDTFSILTFVVPIVGAPAPLPSSGKGSGKVL